MSDKQNDGGVKIKDKRRFSVGDDGVLKNQETDEAEKKASEDMKSENVDTNEQTAEKTEDPKEAKTGRNKGPELPPASFQSLVFSLATAAMMHMGDIADPEGKSAKDIGMAKQTIDLLGILSEKTRGNLTPEEEGFLSSVLRDLRLRFVQAKR